MGTSGETGERRVPVTASARKRPDSTCGTRAVGPSIDQVMWPPSSACVASMASARLNSSLARCGGVPIPGEPEFKV